MAAMWRWLAKGPRETLALPLSQQCNCDLYSDRRPVETHVSLPKIDKWLTWSLKMVVGEQRVCSNHCTCTKSELFGPNKQFFKLLVEKVFWFSICKTQKLLWNLEANAAFFHTVTLKQKLEDGQQSLLTFPRLSSSSLPWSLIYGSGGIEVGSPCLVLTGGAGPVSQAGS